MSEYETIRSTVSGKTVHLRPIITPERRERIGDYCDKITLCLPWGRLGVCFEKCDGPVTCIPCAAQQVRREKGNTE